MKKPLGQGHATVLGEALDALYTIQSVTHVHQCPPTSPDLLCGFHDFTANCDNSVLQLKAYALMALVCHVDLTQRKKENALVSDCSGKDSSQKPLLSYWEAVCKERRFEMMYEAVQAVLTVSGPVTCLLLASASLHCQGLTAAALSMA